MWLIRTIHGDKILDSVDEIKNTNKKDVVKKEIKKETFPFKDILRNRTDLSEVLDIKKADVSKVITSMKKEKIIYTVRDFGWIGID